MEINATLIVQSVLFLLLLIWLSRFLFTPFLELFDARERCINGARLEAAELEQAAQKNLELAENKIRIAQKEARQVLLDLKAEGLEHQRSLLDMAKKEAKLKIQTVETELAQEADRLAAKLLIEAPALSRLAIERMFDARHASGMSVSNFEKMENRSV
jgi:F-type H+-transporting ATPase subunit b